MDNKTNRIGAIAPYAFYGGAEKQFGYFIKNLPSNKPAKVFFFSKCGPNSSISDEDFQNRYGELDKHISNCKPTFSSNNKNIIIHLMNYIKTCLLSVWYLRDRHVVYGYSMYCILPLLLLKILGKKTIYSERLFSIDLQKRGFFYKFLTFFDAIIVNSEELEGWANKRNNNVYFIPNVVDPIEWQASQKHVYKLGIVARVHPEKNIDFVLDALPKEVTLNIYGEIQDESYFSSIQAKAITNNIAMYHYSQCTIEDIYNETDLIILPSKFEGTSNVVLEAIASKKPLLLSRIPANTNLDLHDECYFSIDNATELLDKISYFYRHGYKQEILERNHKTSLNFSAERFKSNINQVFDELN